ncbi:MAG: Flp pilus assembly complex ATPase component TadA [Candidatus Omnitrophica bacterium]|nr:Flp pilus assembly complex ATPase component TadA [Candidatus Omnitrophota bacterium]
MATLTRDASKLIGEQLVKKGIVTPDQLKEATEKQRLNGRLLGEVLIEMGFATEQQVIEALADHLGIAFVDVSTYEVDKEVLSLFPEEILRKNQIIPLFKVDKTVTVAMTDPLNIRVIDRLRFLSHYEIDPLFGTKSAIERALDRYLGSAGSLEGVMRGIGLEGSGEAKVSPAPGGIKSVPASPRSLDRKRMQAAGTTGSASDQVTGLIAAAEKVPVVKIVDAIIKAAVDNRASDIHVEPEETSMYLRYRIDGILYDVSPPPKSMELAIISRIKIMANMDIAERRLPQDGRIQTQVGEKEVDLRVSTFPTIHGENVSIRVLDKSAITLTLEQLGFDLGTLSRFDTLLSRPHGIVLVTGPTGCGKTTTLYAALRTVNAVEKNVITLEDPVEYRIPRIRQSQVDVKAGLTFANGLRSILRQDPDIVLIGEIRDLETSEIAIHAALTGHMVFSTLHTNDAPGALTRLIDMGVEPFLTASSVVGVLAQRLVRTLCAKCKEPYEPTPEILKSLGISPGKKTILYRLKGCEECKKTGYRGRTGVYELMETTDVVRDLVLRKASSREIKEQAVKEGMTTLRKAGISKVLEGLTTVEEVLRVTEHDFEE